MCLDKPVIELLKPSWYNRALLGIKLLLATLASRRDKRCLYSQTENFFMKIVLFYLRIGVSAVLETLNWGYSAAMAARYQKIKCDLHL